MGECKQCPKWEDITNLLERESDVPIRYNVWARHGSCSVHKERAVGLCSDNAVGCLLCDAMDQAERDKQKAKFKWKYLRVQKIELMKDFMKEGGTYHIHMKSILYYTFLIVMLGSLVLGRMVEGEVAMKKNGLLFRRDFSEKFTPVRNGEIQSEGIGNDESVSMEVCSLFYTPKGKEKSEKVLYLHLSDDTTQDAVAVKCHTEYVLDGIDSKGEMPADTLKAVFSIVDGCAVQYRCGTVLHSLAHLAKS